MRDLSQKLEGFETVDPPSLSRRIRREFPDLTSPQTKSASRQLLSEIRRKLDLRVPRRPRTFARLVRNRTTSKVSYHAPLYGYAFSRIKSTPHHHSIALRRHARAKSLGLLSPPHSCRRPHRARPQPRSSHRHAREGRRHPLCGQLRHLPPAPRQHQHRRRAARRCPN